MEWFRARLRLGAELATQISELTFGMDGQYDFVDARFTDGSFVPRIPPHRLGGGAFLRNAAWFARVGVRRALAQNNLVLNETATGGYNLLKAELTCTLKTSPNMFNAKEVRFGVVGTDMLYDEVRNHVSFRKDEVLLPGRSARFFASAQF